MLSIVDQVTTDIEKLAYDCHIKKEKLVRKAIRNELIRLQKKHPELLGVRFGNGTFLLDGMEDKVDYDIELDKNRWNKLQASTVIKTPKYLDRLIDLVLIGCSLWMQDHVYVNEWDYPIEDRFREREERERKIREGRLKK